MYSKKLLTLIFTTIITISLMFTNVLAEESKNENSAETESSTTATQESSVTEESEPTKENSEAEPKKEESSTVEENDSSTTEEETEEEEEVKIPDGSTYAYKRQFYYGEVTTDTVYQFPLEKETSINSGFGYRTPESTNGVGSTWHQGIDLYAVTGDRVLSVNDGIVTIASWQGGYGNLVQIKHTDGSVTKYGHLSEINVYVGQSVVRGQLIGKIGSTGNSTGPHLHFEIYPNGISEEPVDPEPLLKQKQYNIEQILEYSIFNVKFVFIDKEYEYKDTLDTSKIYFVLNERIEPIIDEGRALIDISKYYDNGLLNEDITHLQTLAGYEISIEDKHLVIDEEVNLLEIQVLVPVRKVQRTNIPVHITQGENTKTEILTLNPLFNISIPLEVLNKSYVSVKVDNKVLNTEYYDYTNGVLTISYSCLNVQNIYIEILDKSLEKVEPFKEHLNLITTWIDIDNIDIIKFNTFIDNCYLIKSVLENEITPLYSSVQYNKYNFDYVDGVIQDSVLIDTAFADGYISIPKQLGTLESETDPSITPEDIIIDNKGYNLFIYGETLDIFSTNNIESGYKQVEFKILDYTQDDEYTYFIVFYKVETIGGYFGLRIKNS